MTPDGARAVVADVMGQDAVCAVALQGGLINHVFRVGLADGRTVVLKHAPAHVVTAPSIALDPGRVRVEAAAMRAVGPPRVPRVLAQVDSVLLMEDLGDLPDIVEWVSSAGDGNAWGTLAEWLRGLHDGPALGIHNASMQCTRLDVQYRSVGAWLGPLGVPDGARLAARALALGRRWLRPGPCFVMGDLWPPSVRVRPDGSLVIIDWEMSTQGHRGQDLGHFCAHLALGAHRGTVSSDAESRFCAAYGPVSAETTRDMAVHAGCELLTRSVGAFPMPLTTDQQDAVVQDGLARLRGAG